MQQENFVSRAEAMHSAEVISVLVNHDANLCRLRKLNIVRRDRLGTAVTGKACMPP